jgi:hypothetical protein
LMESRLLPGGSNSISSIVHNERSCVHHSTLSGKVSSLKPLGI